MIGTRYFALAALAVACLHGSASFAADYDPPIYTEPAQEYAPVEVGNGWYLRGDVGYAPSTKLDNVTYRTFDTATTTYTSGNSFASQDLKNELTLGGGIGYRFTDYFRADATVDGFRSKFSGSTTSSQPCSVDVAFDGTTCRSEENGKVSALSVMANGYVDLGTYVGFTPYVGAGAGYSYVRWGSYNDRNFCVGATCPNATFDTTPHDSEHNWRFTYALMAGVAYDLTKSVKLDLGYKYRNINGGNAFGWDAANKFFGASGAQGRDDGWSQHEIKVGLRYELW